MRARQRPSVWPAGPEIRVWGCMLGHIYPIGHCPACRELDGQGPQPEQSWVRYRAYTTSDRIKSLIDERLEGIATGRIMVRS